MENAQGKGNAKPGQRLERDALGVVQLDANSYFGSFTARAAQNFRFTGSALCTYKKAVIKIKLACALANCKCGLLEKSKADAIERACREIYEGKFDEYFPLGFYQAGAGTPFNMNANEVIANRANEILGAPLGSYRHIHPNNDVNMGQSSNDVTPTAIRVALLDALPRLEKAIEVLAETLEAKARKHAGRIKVGRTHLQDAVPIGIGQEIKSWSDALLKDLGLLRQTKNGLCTIGLGGTALGTGIAAHPKFAKYAAEELSRLTGCEIASGQNKPELTSNMNALLAFSSGLRAVAVSCAKMANDFKLLVSGPKAGIAELVIPEVEPGSSIMPGKINPSIPEMLEIVAYDAIGMDHAVALSCLGGQLELNVLTPLIAKNTLESAIALSNGIEIFERSCARGLEYDIAACKKNVDATFIFATALNPYLGYHVVAEIVKESVKSGLTVSQVVLKHGLLGEGELRVILDPGALTSPAPIDTMLAEKIKSGKAYADYLKRIGK
ncbi:aspartate ammonia-lyase [Candidatus Parvarchaeota archaeon]|nr:aspartate ammonia-lyase [Candidatus Parvarchaeota archaeon]